MSEDDLEPRLQAAWQARRGLDLRPEVAKAAAHAAEAMKWLGLTGEEAVEMGLLDMAQRLDFGDEPDGLPVMNGGA